MNLFQYGIDWDGPLTDIDEAEVEETLNPLRYIDYSELQATISPYTDSDCHGVDLYVKTLEFVHCKLF